MSAWHLAHNSRLSYMAAPGLPPNIWQAEADRGLWGYFPLPTLSGLSSQLLAFLKRQMFP